LSSPNYLYILIISTVCTSHVSKFPSRVASNAGGWLQLIHDVSMGYCKLQVIGWLSTWSNNAGVPAANPVSVRRSSSS